jgi:hypothetical protein
MEHNKIITYSLLAHINNGNSGNLLKDLFDVFKPLVKRTLTKMCNEGIKKGENISEIKSRVDDEYKLDIPIPVLKIILSRIANEINQEGVGKFQLYSDNSFAISDYVFVEFDELIKNKEEEIQKLEELFTDFCKINNVKFKKNIGIFEFIDSNKTTISKYLSFKANIDKEDFTTEALFVDYFKNFKEVFDLIKNIYLGSIISSYIEYETNPINLQIELIFDTNFIVSLLDLKTSESTHTCNKLVEIAKSLGYKLNVLNITISETRNLLEKKAEQFDNAFFAKKINPEDIYNACDRKKLNKTDLQRIADNLEEDLGSLGISVVPHTEKYQNLARYSDEYKKFKAIRSNEFAAMHDATVLYYVREKRGNKRIKNFDKVNCWFVNNSSNWQSSGSLISTKGENGYQPETIRAEDFINILWLSNPKIKTQVGEAELAEIGITRMISCTLNETLPKSAIIRELDDNIKKYAAEKISDNDIVRVATRIANRNLKNLEELNKIASTNSEDFVKRLQREADVEREEGAKRMKEFQELIHRLVKKEKQLDEVRGNYKTKLLEAKSTQSSSIKSLNDYNAILTEEKRKRIKAENELIKIKRHKYIAKKVCKWRLKSWIELSICIVIIFLGLIWMLKQSDWNMGKAKDLFIQLNQNLIISLLLWFLSLIFSYVTLTNLAAKYRNQSNIKAFLDNLEKYEMPEEYKDKKD